MSKIEKMLSGEIDYLEGLGIIIGTQHIMDTVVATTKIKVVDKEGFIALRSLLSINNEIKEKIFFDRLYELVANFNSEFGQLCYEMNNKGHTDDGNIMEELVKRMN